MAELSDIDKAMQQLQQAVTSLQAEIRHWKSAHDEMVKRNRQLRDRPDLQDRARSVDALNDELEAVRTAAAGCPRFADGPFIQFGARAFVVVTPLGVRQRPWLWVGEIWSLEKLTVRCVCGGDWRSATYADVYSTLTAAEARISHWDACQKSKQTKKSNDQDHK